MCPLAKQKPRKDLGMLAATLMECDKYKIKAVTHQQQGENQESNQEANPPMTTCQVPETYISGMAQKIPASFVTAEPKAHFTAHPDRLQKNIVIRPVKMAP